MILSLHDWHLLSNNFSYFQFIIDSHLLSNLKDLKFCTAIEFILLLGGIIWEFYGIKLPKCGLSQIHYYYRLALIRIEVLRHFACI